MKLFASTLLAAALLLVAAAESQPRWSTLNQQAQAAIKALDYARLHAVLSELAPLMPGNPRILYNSAAANAKLGHSKAALAELRDLAATGLTYDIAADEDFNSLHKSTEYAAVVTHLAVNKKPVTHSSVAFTLAERDLIPEDIAYDPQTRRFFISSVRKAKIITADGKEFAKADWSVLALRVDAARRILWATIAWVPHCESCAPKDKDKTALLAFDLDTGALKQRIPSEFKGLLGDMTISHNGDVYVAEGIYGGVYLLPRGGTQLQRLDTPGEFPSPQTPALSGDEKTLYVPDYLRGIGVIDLATKKIAWLQPSRSLALNGIDGLYTFGNSFIAVQNGTNPPRVMQFSLDLHSQQPIESNAAGLGEPTHGTFVGQSFYFLANTGWSEYDQNGKKKPGAEPVQSAVWKVDLPLVPAR